MVSAFEDAYQVLGLQRDCSNSDVKKAFQQLAKATHPDLNGDGEKGTTARFIRVLAAYQILSDPEKRAIYDRELFSRVRAYSSTTTQSSNTSSRRRTTTSGTKAKARSGSNASTSGRTWENARYDFSYEDSAEDSEVVEWLRRYRSKVYKIVHERELGTSRAKLFESYQTDIVTALRNIYFGPDFRTLRGFPDAFEAEERSNPFVNDILQLVYGRYQFATVSAAREKPINFPKEEERQNEDDKTLWQQVDRAAYGRLEFRLSGILKAHALRRPLHAGDIHGKPFVIDSISIYSDEDSGSELLGRIHGLASMDAGLKAVVFNAEGTVTHTILQHKTPMVRHLHWYRLEEEKMYCDCRCRRAWLLPSRYWIFQPRSPTHNIGGWYIETFRPKCKHLSPSNKLLHPALYILAAAYNTLDKESMKKNRFSSSFTDSAARLWTLFKQRWKM